jgi:putative transposase
MGKNRKDSHSVYDLKVHIVWVTKYRYHVLKSEKQKRYRYILREVCDAHDIRMLKGVVSKDHIHMHLSYPAKLSISEIVKRLKGRSSRVLINEYPELKKRYWANIFGQ